MKEVGMVKRCEGRVEGVRVELKAWRRVRVELKARRRASVRCE
jgi:hypothetical protein